MHDFSRLASAVCGTVLISLLSPASACADDCQTIIDAYTAMANQPAMQEIIVMTGQNPIEMRIVGDAMYMNDGTGWTSVPAAPGMRENMMKSILPDISALQDCKSSGTGSINGKETRAFDYFLPNLEKMMKGTGQQRVFVGDDGLPYAMRSEGTEVTISYENITAP